MGQAAAETIFDILYLGFAIFAGLIMLVKGRTSLVKKAGLMTVLLGAGIPSTWFPVPIPCGRRDWKPMPPRWASVNLSPPLP